MSRPSSEDARGDRWIQAKSTGRKLVVLHVDGVCADVLEQAIRDGEMPFVRHLMETEGYTIHRYRCGVPSTTPFAQAGILYGDNSEIPSFRWWDRERQVLVQFGPGSTFKKVADKYFRDCEPLTKDGACIAACYPGGAADDFGIAYQDRTYGVEERSRSAAHVLVPYLANPLHIVEWLWQTVVVGARTVKDIARAASSGRHPARASVIIDVVEEIFVHHLTRYAMQQAMREGYSPIYGALYAFDETAHAFGPDDPAALRILKHVDHSIRKIAGSRGDRYELLVLSDHGQIPTTPFSHEHGSQFGQVLASLMPDVRVQEMKGKTFGPSEDDATGRLNVTCSGGLAHLYFADAPQRLHYRELAATHPGLAAAVSELGEVAFVMSRDGEQNVFLKAGKEFRDESARSLLDGYDDPNILLAQLSRLNSFQSSGDLVVFGAFIGGRQVNFEDQAGGHGSIGGVQLHPFVFAKREWSLDTSRVQGADELHPILSRLRDQLAST
jgi:hypothetical protein